MQENRIELNNFVSVPRQVAGRKQNIMYLFSECSSPETKGLKCSSQIYLERKQSIKFLLSESSAPETNGFDVSTPINRGQDLNPVRNRLNGTIYGLLITLLLLAGCHKEDPKPVQYYLGSEEVLSFTSTEIKNGLFFAGLSDLAVKMKYDVKVYKFNYHINYQGVDRTASGLLAVPITSDPLPMASLQHGTIAANKNAPSVGYNDYSTLTWFASLGYILAIPDYIGFGETADLLHPYYHAEYTAMSVINMLFAARQYANQESLAFNNKLFLAGYSEGGFATMATHMFLENDHPEEFELVASSPGAGGYDINGMLEYFFAMDTYPDPFYIAYVAMAYKETYDLENPLSDFFNAPYASVIPTLFDGDLSAGQINGQLTNDLGALLNPDFKANAFTDPKYSALIAAFKENSPIDWTPKAPVIMYHGTDDVVIPYGNSENVYNKMIGNGAPNIELVPIEGEGHGSGFMPYLFSIIERFEGMK